MLSYVLRRLLLVIPTLLGIVAVNFFIVQLAPGGPVDVVIAQLKGTATDPSARFTGGGSDTAGPQNRPNEGQASGDSSRYRGARGIDPAIIKEIERTFGFDKPLGERFWLMLKRYATLDFGRSYFRDKPVVDLVLEKLPVSISLGLWTTLLVYLISIPLGVRKAVRDGSRFDVWTSGAVIVGDAIPAFLFAVLLVVLFAGGSFFKWFPLRGLTSEGFDQLSALGKALDYAWHMALPIAAMVIGGFASLTLLTKNSFLDEINKQYVVTARAKGLAERRVLYGHIFRNAMLLVIAGFPQALISILFTGSLLIEIIFSLDGIGLLGWEATLNRDYPVMFGTLFVFTLIGLVLKIVSDLIYMAVDPRIDFEARR
ncbi:MAG: microcin C ABC transporter permease YejB [Alphaproteobacteria bacterium]|nr:microcin C ABC transporter permease YejB [Alphaproteobacteria bacterium]